jgi:hypothetical protein
MDILVPKSGETQEGKPEGTPNNKPEDQPSSQKKRRMTVHLTQGLVDRIHAAVFWTPGESVTELVERAVTVEIDQMEEERGGPFPLPRK